MKRFLLGVVSTLVVLAVAAVAVLLSLGDDGGGSTPSPAPSVSSSRVADPPDDLAADETWLGTVDLRSDDVVSAEGDLSGVVATGQGVRFSPTGLRAQRLDVDATVPFATVAGQVGDGTRVYSAGGGLAGVERRVTILGRDLTVTATGTVRADGGQLLIEPETVDLGGPSFIDAAASALARALVTIRQPVAGVPDGLALTAVRVVDDGFAARLTGSDVTIGR